jgi:hypothetical protein
LASYLHCFSSADHAQPGNFPGLLKAETTFASSRETLSRASGIPVFDIVDVIDAPNHTDLSLRWMPRRAGQTTLVAANTSENLSSATGQRSEGVS